MEKKYCSIGGQALIEGVMMRSPNDIAIAVRKPDGDIEIKKDKVKGISKTNIMKVPILRGMFALFSSMIVGMKALTYSAEFYADDPTYEPKGMEKWFYDKFGDKADDILVAFSMVFAVVLAMLLFGVLPTFVVYVLKSFITNTVVMSIVEGVLKIALFLGYITIISMMKDVRRVFEYHGAEHKVIHCFESGEELTVENARKFTTLHPRCGTSFILIVLVTSIIVYSFVTWNTVMGRLLLKLCLLPLITGFSYEVIKWAGKGESKLVKAISYPGLMMQKLTTKEPDDKQLEVAIEAMKSVL